ncbi:MAG TPA: 4Fe-4S dicluster domain-containing protein [Bryobacteraceae bacterium]|nr:4Fe-4S dicluster domain-containing protein [Bryobacteraceae bacterium]
MGGAGGSVHPHIDPTYCIGCQTCTMVCPETNDFLKQIGIQFGMRDMTIEAAKEAQEDSHPNGSLLGVGGVGYDTG